MVAPARKTRQGSASKTQVLRIPLAQIRSNPRQPRKYFDQQALAELAASIKARGLLQPVLVNQKGKRFVLVAGERRLRAAKMAGLREVPALLTDHDPLEVSLIENLQRTDLNPIEEAEGYRLLAEEYGYTHQQIASKLGKSRYAVTESLALIRLPDEIKRKCGTSYNYSKCLLLEVARQKTRAQMLGLWEKIEEGHLTVREAKKAADRRPTTRFRSLVLPPLRTINRLDKQLSAFDYERLTDEERKNFRLRLVAIMRKIQKAIDRLGSGLKTANDCKHKA